MKWNGMGWNEMGWTKMFNFFVLIFSREERFERFWTLADGMGWDGVKSRSPDLFPAKLFSPLPSSYRFSSLFLKVPLRSGPE